MKLFHIAVAALCAGAPLIVSCSRGEISSPDFVPGSGGTGGSTAGGAGTSPTSGAGTNGSTGVTGAAGRSGTPATTGTAGTTATPTTGAAGTTATPTTGAAGTTAPPTTGAAGTTAPPTTGAAGATGTTGAAGSPAPTGAAGHPGTTGAAGSPAPTGAAGHPGTTGAAGSPAPTGAAGATGTTGAAGSPAPTGAAGHPGTTGAAGSPAPTGAAGSPGTTGAAGSPAPTGSAGTTGAGGSTTASTAGGTIVPLYTDPSDGSWNAIVAAKQAHPTVTVIAIVNPADGPGSSVSSGYTTGIAKLTAANIKVIGYVATGYAANAISSVEAKIDQWKSFYPQLSGIFFDEQSNQAGDVAYYRTLSQYAKGKGLSYTVGNPGTDTAEAYIGALDTMLIYETDGLPSTAQMAGWHTKYPTSNFGVIPYATAMNAQFVHDARKYVGYIYLQNDNLPNPWDSLPSYFADLLAALE